MKTRWIALATSAMWMSCVNELPKDAVTSPTTPADKGAALDHDTKQNRALAIIAEARSRGITNPVILAGVAEHESGLAQCYDEATWACDGPYSNDCGGPALAGGGDGPCDWHQGGIGMFQLDGGTFDQTLAQYGNDVVDVGGNVRAGVNVIIQKVWHCPNTPDYPNGEQDVVNWLNAATPGSDNFETYLSAMAWCYNGCAPGSTSCSYDGMRENYRAGVQRMLDQFGADFWNGDGAAPPPPGAQCLSAMEACNDGSQCCADLDCGSTTLGQVCCGEQGHSCGTADGSDCCGDLECVNGTCTPPNSAPQCKGATETCGGNDECCGDLACGATSLGQVCCGEVGHMCNTPDGSDCCGDEWCVAGVCQPNPNAAPAPSPPPPPPTPAPPPPSSPPSSGTCNEATQSCSVDGDCCAGLECGTTSIGQVCCGGEGAACNTPDGSDCCGNLWCVAGTCQPPPAQCEGPCQEPPALEIEKQRLTDVIGGTFLGICGDANHTWGYHVAAAQLPMSDYSMTPQPLNTPVCAWEAAAIDIGMDWPASRTWLPWLIRQIREDKIKNVYEVIGSLDGVTARYWSDDSGWMDEGVPYEGTGHIEHTHVSIYRSTTEIDHHLLDGWTATGGPP